MKDTKQKLWYRFYVASKFQYSLFDGDKQNILNKYNELSYRDAKITYDTVYFDDESLNLEMTIDEGKAYFIRSITWSGNKKYSSGLQILRN